MSVTEKILTSTDAPSTKPRMAAGLSELRVTVFAILGSLLIGAVVLLVAGYNPLEAYRYFLLDNFTSLPAFANLLNTAIPLLILALSTIIAFRSGVFSVGQEGQMYLGALAAAVTVLSLPALPGFVLIVVALLAGVVVGAIWGGIVGALRAWLGVDEILTSLMLNYVAVLITLYLVRAFFKAPGVGMATAVLPEEAWIPATPSPFNVSAGILLAVVLTIGTWVVLFRTPVGTRLKAIASSLRFANSVGVPSATIMVVAVAVSGAVSGIAGANLVLSSHHQFIQDFSPGYGFVGLAVALLARLSPFGSCLVALIYAAFINGASTIQIFTSVPQQFVNILIGTVIILATSKFRSSQRADKAS